MPDEIQSDVEKARTYLENQFMKADTDWLQGCVDFFRNEPGKKYNTGELNSMVRDQWMLCDLREICPGSLPSNLANQIKVTITGGHVLQMNYLVNIAVPAYQQLQKLRKVDTTDVEVTAFENNPNKTIVTSNRMLKLFLTDGVQDISAIEYKPMRNLDCNLIPGVKILVTGPVQCRRGTFLLEEKNVKILGGEVDNLIGVNHFEKVLARTIGITDNSVQHMTPPEFTREAHNPPQIAPVRNVPEQNINLEDIQEINESDFADDDELDIDQIAALENQILLNLESTQNQPAYNFPDDFVQNSNAPNFAQPALSSTIPTANSITNYEWSPPMDIVSSLDVDENMLKDMSNVTDIPYKEPPFNVNSKEICNINTSTRPKHTASNINSKISIAPRASSFKFHTNNQIPQRNKDNFTSNLNITPDSRNLNSFKNNTDIPNIQHNSNSNIQSATNSYNSMNCNRMNQSNIYASSIESYTNPHKKQKLNYTFDVSEKCSNANSIDDFTADDFDEPMENIKEPTPIISMNSHFDPQPSSSFSKPQPSIINKPSIYEDHFAKHRPDNDDKTVLNGSSNTKPVTKINRLKMIPDAQKLLSLFTVRAKIKTLIGKLQLMKGRWSLKCILEDGTGLLEVEFSNEILCNMIGYSPAEMARIKKEMNVRPDLKEKVMKGLERTKEQLQTMHAYMDIKYEPNPRIVCVHE